MIKMLTDELVDIEIAMVIDVFAKLRLFDRLFYTIPLTS